MIAPDPSRLIVPGQSIGPYTVGASVELLPRRALSHGRIVAGDDVYKIVLRGVVLWVRRDDSSIVQIGAKKKSGACFVGGLGVNHSFGRAFDDFGDPKEWLETYVFRGLPFTVMETTDVKERHGWDEKKTRIHAIYVFVPLAFGGGPRAGEWESWFDALPPWTPLAKL